MKNRPPLPSGPYLVVGLRLAGAAVARVLLHHGQVMGCDQGRPKGAAHWSPALSPGTILMAVSKTSAGKKPAKILIVDDQALVRLEFDLEAHGGLPFWG